MKNKNLLELSRSKAYLFECNKCHNILIYTPRKNYIRLFLKCKICNSYNTPANLSAFDKRDKELIKIKYVTMQIANFEKYLSKSEFGIKYENESWDSNNDFFHFYRKKDKIYSNDTYLDPSFIFSHYTGYFNVLARYLNCDISEIFQQLNKSSETKFTKVKKIYGLGFTFFGTNSVKRKEYLAIHKEIKKHTWDFHTILRDITIQVFKNQSFKLHNIDLHGRSFILTYLKDSYANKYLIFLIQIKAQSKKLTEFDLWELLRMKNQLDLNYKNEKFKYPKLKIRNMKYNYEIIPVVICEDSNDSYKELCDKYNILRIETNIKCVNDRIINRIGISDLKKIYPRITSEPRIVYDIIFNGLKDYFINKYKFRSSFMNCLSIPKSAIPFLALDFIYYDWNQSCRSFYTLVTGKPPPLELLVRNYPKSSNL